jgi:hypothetical protein
MRLVKLILASALAALTLPLAAQQNLPLTPPVSTEQSAKLSSAVLVVAALVVPWLALAFNLMDMTVNY